MAKKKQGLRKRARRDVRVALAPQFRDLERQEREASQLLETSTGRTGQTYERLQNDLARLLPGFVTQNQGIGQNLISDMGQLASTLGINAPTSGEGQAAQNLMGNIGGGGLNLLASGAQRNLGYGQSSVRQAGIDQASIEQNYLNAFRDVVEEIRQGRFDLKGDMGQQISARLDELRDRRADRKLAQQELELRQELAEKQLGFQKKQYRQGRRGERRARRAATKQLTAEERRTRKRRLGNKISDLAAERAAIKKQYPGLEKRNGMWGRVTMAGGNPTFTVIPEANRRMKAISKKIKGRKRKRANL